MSFNLLTNTISKINKNILNQPYSYIFYLYKYELNNYNNLKYISNPLIINRIITINNNVNYIILKNINNKNF
jgi:hypothetical protein